MDPCVIRPQAATKAKTTVEAAKWTAETNSNTNTLERANSVAGKTKRQPWRGQTLTVEVDDEFLPKQLVMKVDDEFLPR